MSSKVLELFGQGVRSAAGADWAQILRDQQCPYTRSKCFKVRKSEPDVSIGTCTVRYGRSGAGVIICPNRLLQNKQPYIDCMHLLAAHEPGNELHAVPEISVPGGSVDHMLVSARSRRVRDFVGVEFQTLDTTGTVWPERQRLVQELGLGASKDAVESTKTFGMNWKMTAKTTLVQLHHKIETFEHIHKRLVLVVQDCLLDYMSREFRFDHLTEPPSLGDSMFIHAYSLQTDRSAYKIELSRRLSTDAAGIAKCLGLQAEAKVDAASIVSSIEARMSDSTLLPIF